MKKLLVLVTAILLVIMSIPTLAHDKVTYAEWGTPTIDAVKEDVWDKAQYIEVADEASGDASELGQQSPAKVYSLWDGDYIYFYAIVTDPTVEAVVVPAGTDASDQDCIGFMLDLAYVRDEPGVSYRDLGEDSYAGYVDVPAVAGDNNYPDSIFTLPGYKENIKSYCRVTGSGYEVEIALPLKYKEYKPGDKIGYEIFLNNSIGEGSRYGYTVWYNPEDGGGSESWRYTYNMGTLIFNEKTAEPESVETPVTTSEAPAAVSSPKTYDLVTVSIAIAAISLVGFAASKKR